MSSTVLGCPANDAPGATWAALGLALVRGSVPPSARGHIRTATTDDATTSTMTPMMAAIRLCLSMDCPVSAMARGAMACTGSGAAMGAGVVAGTGWVTVCRCCAGSVRICWAANASSPALWYRSAGALAIALAINASHDSGTEAKCEILGGGAERCALMIAGSELPEPKGGCPVNMRKRVQPKA
ncbi:Uncharacterised protein [Mycobacteroides abscessus subsp. abscessus]|nr:Uncharacterised protein [Mycobacteroides abscessus subsp. abscessus]